MGGDVSHEFMVPADAGEDEILACDECHYASNKEKTETFKPESGDTEDEKPIENVPTPKVTTIEAVTDFLGTPADHIVKTLIFDNDGEPVAVLVRGDHDANPIKVARALGVAEVDLASEKMIFDATGGPIGFSGPVGLTIRVLADHAVGGLKNFTTGANAKDAHYINVNWGRDAELPETLDLRYGMEGDPCPKCGKPMALCRGIEIGHVFKLGTKYSEKMQAMFQDEDNANQPMVMGCYGIGVNRIVASAIESYHDDQGIVWPWSIAPFHIVIVALGYERDEAVQKAADAYHDELTAAGYDVLLDDRKERPGVKFSDAELLGIPLRITVGGRGLGNGVVELKARTGEDAVEIPVDTVLDEINKAADAYRKNFAAGE
jgi:prolyl-tRNA synthetase